jgi:hypothetical protein
MEYASFSTEKSAPGLVPFIARAWACARRVLQLGLVDPHKWWHVDEKYVVHN